MRKEVAEREQAEEEARVVIKPLEEPRNRRRRNDEGGTALDFTVERKEAGNGDVWYEVLGTKPERWVMQTNFDNDEAVGYLADRLAKLGVEDELRNKGANLATKYASARVREPWNSIGIRPLLRARKCSTAPAWRTRRRPATAGTGRPFAAPHQRGTPSPVPRNDGCAPSRA